MKYFFSLGGDDVRGEGVLEGEAEEMLVGVVVEVVFFLSFFPKKE